ncbi:MAG: prepilin-type N-terminal cleavage/methylation domain-containing protein [Elusimicrobiota bacterium]
MKKTMKRQGFTLIELLVVVLIIGILAAIAVPQYFKVIEKSRAAEATSLFDTIRGAEDRYQVQTGSYYIGTLAAGCLLDVCQAAGIGTLKYFTAGNVTAIAGGWSLAMTRVGNPVGFGNYVLTYTRNTGGISTIVPSGCTTPATCAADLGLQ